MWIVFVSLVVLCWTGIAQSSLGCPSWNQFHLGRMNSKIIHLLDNMVRQRERPNSHACTRTTDTLLIKSIFSLSLSIFVSFCVSPPCVLLSGRIFTCVLQGKTDCPFFPRKHLHWCRGKPCPPSYPPLFSPPLLSSPLNTYLLFFVYRRTQSHCLSCKRGSCSSRFLGAIWALCHGIQRKCSSWGTMCSAKPPSYSSV